MQNDINDDPVEQGITIIAILLNDILKGTDNSSLGSRALICIHSKLQSMLWIIVTALQKKI